MPVARVPPEAASMAAPTPTLSSLVTITRPTGAVMSPTTITSRATQRLRTQSAGSDEPKSACAAPLGPTTKASTARETRRGERRLESGEWAKT
jgi:hypothetical protein